ncbi:MAG: FkbM family methyltransferase [Bacteroidetes bacterium]|nr:MAG: FkbM family methyltransferase [Bacteroidota bacterium]
MLKSILLLITKFIPSGIIIPIFSGPLKGLKWVAGAAEGNGKGLSLILNMCEPEQIKKAVQISSKDKIVFDIGANVGMYSILYSKFCKQVYCFEPLPRNLHFLYKILTINNMQNATIVPFAVGGELSMANFQISDKNSEGKISELGNQPAIIVGLENFIHRYNITPNIIKIDVEGAEFVLLNAAKDFLTKSKQLEIVLSVHSFELRESCLTLLSQCGFNTIEPLNGESRDNAFEYYISKC